MAIAETTGAGTVEAHPAGFAAWLRALWMRLMGTGPATASQFEPSTSNDNADEKEVEGSFVMTPCGYRIRVPDESDVGHSLGEMLPTVREGLSLLPPLPSVIIDLLREIQDPKSTSASVAGIASNDPALAASLLRAANGAALGLARTITSVSEAVSYLGFGTVKAMVISLRLGEVMVPRDEEAARDAEDLWVHSLAVSYAAEELAKRISGVDKGFVSTLGLLHDIGKMAILAQLPGEAKLLREMCIRDDVMTQAIAREASVLGVDHAGIGANLAAKWKLPADLVQAIRWHHRPASAFHPADPPALRKALHIVQIANQLAKYCYPHTDRMEIYTVADEVFAMLGLEPSMSKLLTGAVRDAISRAVFFATENTRRPATAPRRFLRPLTKDEASRFLSTPAERESRIVEDEAAIAALFSPDVQELTVNAQNIPEADGLTHARFKTAASSTSIETCLLGLKAHRDTLGLSAVMKSAVTLTVQSLLPNLLPLSSPEDKIEVAQAMQDGLFSLAIRAPGLAVTRRLGSAQSAGAAGRLAEVDLASLLNLGWFERIAVSADGSTVVFVGR
jgi:putative nucleotidyltransferase with HDIG domain